MKVKKFQMGGEMPAEEMPQEQMPQGGQGGEEMGGGPEEQIMMMAEEIVGQLGPEGAMMLAEAIAQMVQGGGGGQPAPQEAPAYQRKGGKMVPLR